MKKIQDKKRMDDIKNTDKMKELAFQSFKWIFSQKPTKHKQIKSRSVHDPRPKPKALINAMIIGRNAARKRSRATKKKE